MKKDAPPMFDLSSITEQTSAEIEILHPVTRAPTGARITLAGPEHPDRKRLQFERQRRLRASFAKKGRFDVVDPEQEEADDLEWLAACTLGWRGFADAGKPIEFSAAAVKALYARPEMTWLRRQVQAALADLENFIKSSGAA